MLAQSTPLSEYLPQLPLAERDRRWSGIRARMEQAGIQCLLIHGTGRSEHVRYISQLPVRGVALFLFDREPIVLSDGLTASKYAPECSTWVADVREDVENLPRVLKGLGLDGTRIGVVWTKSPHTRMPAQRAIPMAGLVKEALPRAELVDASQILEELEMIKSPAEMEFLGRAADIAYEVFEAMANSLRPGKTEQQVYAAVLAAQTASGGDVTDVWLDIGSPPRLHGRYPPYTSREIRKGDMLITEYHASFAGYLIATEHTFSLGEPREELRAIHRVAEECFQEGTASMVPGAEFADVIAAYRAPADRAGMAYVELGVHGHGLRSCEFPSTVFGGKGGILGQHRLGQIPDVRLQAGMVFGQNIDVHNPSWNPNTGVMLGNTIWVTDDGPRVLTRVPTELTVV